jgi:phosphate starvation-inducible PhoH-like protein
MRGRTLAHCYAILDEAQNTTPAQMKMFLTRMGEGSRMVVTGDPTQVDLPPGQGSGLHEALAILDGVEGIAVARFSERDVVRHPLVARIVAAYGRADAGLAYGRVDAASARSREDGRRRAGLEKDGTGK